MIYPKQAMFCKEYIKHFNGSRAARDAGYSAKTADVQACNLLTKVKVRERLAELMKLRNESLKVDADYVLRRLIQIDKLDVIDIVDDTLDNFKPLSEWPEEWRKSISGFDLMTIHSKTEDIESVIKKIKWPDKTRNLELLGKHVNVKAFEKESSVVVANNIMLVPTADSVESWEEAAAKHQDKMNDA